MIPEDILKKTHTHTNEREKKILSSLSRWDSNTSLVVRLSMHSGTQSQTPGKESGFRRICVKLDIRRFSRSLITILKSKLKKNKMADLIWLSIMLKSFRIYLKRGVWWY